MILAACEDTSLGHVLEHMSLGGGVAVVAVAAAVAAIATAFIRWA